MAMKSYRYHQRDWVTEFFRLLRANYFSSDDYGAAAVTTTTATAPLVTKRSEHSYVSARDTSEWIQERYRRQLENRTRGFFTNECDPYVPLGQPELDAQRLVIKDLADCLDDNILGKYEQFLRRRDMPNPVLKDADRKKSIAKKDSGVLRAQMQKRKATCAKAGLQDIKVLLREVKNRRVVVKAGGSYVQHVLMEKAKAQKAAADKEEEDKTASSMTLSKLSDQYLADSLATTGIPLDDRITSLAEEYGRQEDGRVQGDNTSHVNDISSILQPKGQSFLQRITLIYNILCRMYNIKSRWLKQRNPLSEDVFEALQRNPFLHENVKPLTPLEPQRPRENRRVSMIVGSLAPPRPSIAPPAVRVGTGGGQGSSRLSIFRHPDGVAPSGILAKLDLPNSLNHNKRRTTHVHYGSKEESDGRMFPVMTPVGPPRLDTWEDLVNANTKRSARIQKRVPPWYVTVTNNMPPIKMEEKMTERGPEIIERDKDHHHDFTTITKLQDDLIFLKENMKDHAQQQTKKLEKERLVKFHAKSAMLDDLWQQPLWERQRLCLDQLNRRPLDVASATNGYPSWFEQLQQECVNLRLAEDAIVLNMMNSLSRFAKEDLANANNIKEKLALVVCSTPVPQICTPQMQQAIKFVIGRVLELKRDHLEQWLNYRNLYVI